MKIESMTVGKSRSLKRGRNETWIKCDVRASFDEPPTEEQVNELLSIVEDTLDLEEQIERERWDALKDQSRQQQVG